MLYRAQNVPKAYDLFLEVLRNHTRPEKGRSPWSDSIIETTKGKLIYSRGEREEGRTGRRVSQKLHFYISTFQHFYISFFTSLAKLSTSKPPSPTSSRGKLPKTYIIAYTDVQITLPEM